MLRIRQVKVNIDATIEDIKSATAKKLSIKKEEIKELTIHKQSLDARKKPQLFYVYEVDINLINEKEVLKKNSSNDCFITPDESYKINITGTNKLSTRPIIIGAGPAGLFCAYILAESGYKPIIYERGKCVEKRILDVNEFWKSGKLNENSNVQFGEGGAGTFSDGKLNTLIKDENNRMRKVFETFVLNGADSKILYENKPHIGTDVLENVVVNMRNYILKLGGEIHYNSLFNDLEFQNNKISRIKINDTWINTDILVLAIGHSARDTFRMLYNNNINMQSKPFAVGLRIEHPQKLINENQYGINYPDILSAASYKLTHTTKEKRGVYTFCMCPGGYVVNASSEDKKLVINGMSYQKRDSKNANSAIICTVNEADYGSGVLAGVRFQEELEQKAYELGNGKIPTQLIKDYYNNQISTAFKNVEPLTKGNTSFANLNLLFNDEINNSIKEAIKEFSKKIKHFDMDDAILFGVESRTSSPVRIIRNDFMLSSINGIYPIGEGAGYAGGITSSAVDGIKCAEEIMKIYQP